MLISKEVENMLMKLARFDNKNIEPDIAACCSKNNAHYVPIIKNRFGILTDDYEISFDKDEYTDEPDINLKSFVNIYQCVVNITNAKRRKFLFWNNKRNTPYNGKILDNVFFKRVIIFCAQNKIQINYVQITSEFNTRDIISDTEEIQELANQKGDFIIEKLALDLKNKSVIFDKVGYVDIASNFDFFENNKDIILSMILVGFEE